jgi:hypothetical protein
VPFTSVTVRSSCWASSVASGGAACTARRCRGDLSLLFFRVTPVE